MNVWKVVGIVVVAIGVAFSAYLLIAHGAPPPATPDAWAECMTELGFPPDETDPNEVDLDRLFAADEACRS